MQIDYSVRGILSVSRSAPEWSSRSIRIEKLRVARNRRRILTDHGVGDEQNLMRRCAGLDRDQFLHQVVINMQTSAGVQNDHVVTLGTCLIDAMFAGAHGIG